MEVRYWNVGAGVRPRGLEFISGFTWSLKFQFDPVAETLDLTAISAPSRISSFGLSLALTSYNEALPSRILPDIDISTFTHPPLPPDTFPTRRPLTLPSITPSLLP